MLPQRQVHPAYFLVRHRLMAVAIEIEQPALEVFDPAAPSHALLHHPTATVHGSDHGEDLLKDRIALTKLAFGLLQQFTTQTQVAAQAVKKHLALGMFLFLPQQQGENALDRVFYQGVARGVVFLRDPLQVFQSFPGDHVSFRHPLRSLANVFELPGNHLQSLNILDEVVKERLLLDPQLPGKQAEGVD